MDPDPEVKPGGSSTNTGDGVPCVSIEDAEIIQSYEAASGCKTKENKPGQAATPSDQKLEETCTRHSLSKEKLFTFFKYLNSLHSELHCSGAALLTINSTL